MKCEQSSRIRKSWLFMLFFMPIFYLANFGVMAYGALSNKLPPEISSELVTAGDRLFQNALLSLIQFPIMLYFSYKKKGSKLLTLSIWGVAVFLAVHLFKLPGLYNNLLKVVSVWQVASKWTHYILMYGIGYFLCHVAIAIIWGICCYKLRKLNFKDQLQEILSIENYRSLFDHLKEIPDLQTLNEFYGKSVRTYPEIAKFLSIEHKRRKKEL